MKKILFAILSFIVFLSARQYSAPVCRFHSDCTSEDGGYCYKGQCHKCLSDNDASPTCLESLMMLDSLFEETVDPY